MTAVHHVDIDEQTYTLTTHVGSGRIRVGYPEGPKIAMWEPENPQPWVILFEGFESFQLSGHKERMHARLVRFDARRRGTAGAPAPQLDQSDLPSLCYYQEILGLWEIRYPNGGGSGNPDYVERLELRADGTYQWNPSPAWAAPVGRWGMTPVERGLNLYFEQRGSTRLRGNHLVAHTIPHGGGTQTVLYWQRIFVGAVVFADIVMKATRSANSAGSGTASLRWS